MEQVGSGVDQVGSGVEQVGSGVERVGSGVEHLSLPINCRAFKPSYTFSSI